MIKVFLTRNPQGKIIAFSVQGHAGFAPHGQDIVCSAVSAIAHTAVYGMDRVAGVKPQVQVREGFLECKVPEYELSPEEMGKIELILETMLVGLQEIQKNYSNCILIKDFSSINK